MLTLAVYKQRLRIYTAGNGRIYMLTFLRFATIIALCFVTIIVAPAHWVNGSPLWLVAGGMYLDASHDHQLTVDLDSVAGRFHTVHLCELDIEANSD